MQVFVFAAVAALGVFAFCIYFYAAIKTISRLWHDILTSAPQEPEKQPLVHNDASQRDTQYG